MNIINTVIVPFIGRNACMNAIRLSLIVTLFFTSCSSQKEQNDQIAIGVVAPLSGNFAFYGNEVKDALLLIEKYENPDNRFDFIFEDNQGSASNSVTAFKKLALDDNIQIIFSCNSPFSIPLRPLAAEEQKVLLAMVTGARDFGKENEWSFRDAINQDQEGISLAKYLIESTEVRNGVTYVVNDDYGLGGARAFVETFLGLNGNIILQETFEMDDRNMRNTLVKLLAKNPEFIFVVGREQSLISTINQIREVDKEIMIVTSDAFDSPNVLEGVGENASGVVYANYYHTLDNDRAKEFISKFTGEFGREPGIYAIDTYVAGKYITEIIGRVGNNGEAIRKELSTLKYESFLKGNLYVNESRDVISPVAIFGIEEDLKKIILRVIE